jgi:hypothetical protein
VGSIVAGLYIEYEGKSIWKYSINMYTDVYMRKRNTNSIIEYIEMHGKSINTIKMMNIYSVCLF